MTVAVRSICCFRLLAVSGLHETLRNSSSRISVFEITVWMVARCSPCGCTRFHSVPQPCRKHAMVESRGQHYARKAP
ncbi:hypothetical protein C8R45DRAFT_954071 [Mycena sanguinolenta]|nr:hypothetical protein C8R45DRAFT_954071 [Mycena sanguinolenta]